MKKMFFLSLSVLAVTVLGSCQHEEIDSRNVINEICDDICGAYIIESIRLVDGGELDLDGDGVANQELEFEFRRLPSAVQALTYVVRVEREQKYDLKRYFRMEIPVQYLEYDASSEKYSFANSAGHGGTANFSLFYSVLSSGNLTYGYGSDSSQFASDFTIETEKGIDIVAARYYSIVRFGNGVLNFIVNSMYYDFASKKCVYVPVSFTYRKLS